MLHKAGTDGAECFKDADAIKSCKELGVYDECAKELHEFLTVSRSL